MGFDKNLNTKVDSPMGLTIFIKQRFFEIQIKSLLLVSLKFNINILFLITSVQEVIEVKLSKSSK